MYAGQWTLNMLVMLYLSYFLHTAGCSTQPVLYIISQEIVSLHRIKSCLLSPPYQRILQTLLLLDLTPKCASVTMVTLPAHPLLMVVVWQISPYDAPGKNLFNLK